MAEALILKSGGGITSDEVTASRAQVLEGYTAVTNDSGDEAAQGTMPNRQAVSVTLKAGDVYAVPAGYHNGNGRVTANNLTVQTPGDATAANITSGRKAWVNGVQIVGNGADNTTFYNNGITYADSRINNSSASYTSGYANGVTTADSRVNPNSESYKNGFSNGVASVKLSVIASDIVIASDSNIASATYTATKECYVFAAYAGEVTEGLVGAEASGGTIITEKELRIGYQSLKMKIIKVSANATLNMRAINAVQLGGGHVMLGYFAVVFN